MAIIEVNHQSIRNAASAIDTYCEELNREMSKADSSVKNMLTSYWIGPDALEFGGKWESVDSASSTAIRFRDSLENYSEALKSCAHIYEEAQERVYNLASLLPKY